jgi:hypothetical protein
VLASHSDNDAKGARHFGQRASSRSTAAMKGALPDAGERQHEEPGVLPAGKNPVTEFRLNNERKCLFHMNLLTAVTLLP